MKVFNKYLGWQYVAIQFTLFGLILCSAYYEHKINAVSMVLIIRILSISLLTAGSIILILAVISFRQRMSPLPYPSDKSTLIKTGIYSKIRHPIYASLMLLFLGYILYWQAYFSLILWLFLLIFFIQKVKIEEKYLNEKFEDYTDYSSTTFRFFPFIY